MTSTSPPAALQLPALIEDAASVTAPCISIYLPTHRSGRETRQDPSRMKNALRSAREQAGAAGLTARTLDPVLAPAEQLLGDHDFWQHQQDGLAVLLAPGWQRVLRLPLAFAEQVVVADRLHLKPLLPLHADVPFHLLALSQNQVRLFRGSRWGLELLPAGELPANLAEALWMDDPERSLQSHSFRVPHAMRTVFHGQGVSGNDEQDKKDLERYFRRIDQALQHELGGSPLPLLLACGDYYAAVFEATSTHPDLVLPPLAGNPDDVAAEQLHAAAWQHLAPRLDRQREAAVATYREQAGTGRTSDVLAAVVNAAQNGRVHELFVADEQHRWGRPSADGAASPELHDERQPGDIDLLDHAVVATLAQGGRAFAMAAADVPGRDAVAATLRY